MTQDTHGRVLSVIACGAGPATAIGTFVQLAQERGWTVQVIATPAALGFFDQAAIEKATGSPVRSQYSKPGAPRSQIADAIIVAPATVNTINKWGAGICDTLALGILVEAIGKRLPIVAVPCTNRDHAAHPAFAENVAKLRSWGVEVLLGPDLSVLPVPGTGDGQLQLFPWLTAIEAIEARTANPQTG